MPPTETTNNRPSNRFRVFNPRKREIIAIGLGTGILLIIAMIAYVFIIYISRSTLHTSESNTNTDTPWSTRGNNTWTANGTTASCADPLEIQAPVDINLVTGILYPGQVRGGDFKPHGGFAFDNLSDNKVIVKLPEDAVLWRAARYIERGEVQYLVDFMTECGIAYRFDHLLSLSDKAMNILSTTPTPNDNTLTTNINPPVAFKKGEVLATEVGSRTPLSVGFDFGVYDLRKQNTISQTNSAWAARYQAKGEYAYYAICWLDNLAGQDKFTARNLPARGSEGKTSDYCH